MPLPLSTSRHNLLYPVAAGMAERLTSGLRVVPQLHRHYLAAPHLVQGQQSGMQNVLGARIQLRTEARLELHSAAHVQPAIYSLVSSR
jgi:hypothetical protein